MGSRDLSDQEEESDMHEVEKVIGKRFRRGKLEYLIKWAGYDNPDDNTWEPVENVIGCLDLVREYEREQEAATGGGGAEIRMDIFLMARRDSSDRRERRMSRGYSPDGSEE